jgi:hypothetical protein
MMLAGTNDLTVAFTPQDALDHCHTTSDIDDLHIRISLLFRGVLASAD